VPPANRTTDLPGGGLSQRGIQLGLSWLAQPVPVRRNPEARVSSRLSTLPDGSGSSEDDTGDQ
jgi:hypothetical protein